ncbi:MAG: hypothetical protein FJX66_09890 [Alphaproteobacteria bacterium]|nr:hypothetical protein [Alphaproteobacteria bacterium]
MSGALGTSPYVFLGVTVLLAGGAAWLMGQTLGRFWRPYWQALIYALLLGLGDRFIIYALFDGELLSPTGFVIDLAVITGIVSAAYWFTWARTARRQYPWLYG